MLVRNDARNMMAEKMPKAYRNRPCACPTWVSGTSLRKSWATANRDSQNAPNPQNSTPPTVLPMRSWMTPAMNWASPPNMSATPKTTGRVATGTRLA